AAGNDEGRCSKRFRCAVASPADECPPLGYRVIRGMPGLDPKRDGDAGLVRGAQQGFGERDPSAADLDEPTMPAGPAQPRSPGVVDHNGEAERYAQAG